MVADARKVLVTDGKIYPELPAAVVPEEEEEEDEGRQWGNKLDFIMSCISYAVGLGNIWRFPYKCYKNGGGAFLIPYFICWFLVGVPMFFFETSLGQQFRLGGIGVWNNVPMFKGIGLASLTIASLVSVYYAIIIAWAILYLASSFMATLPWRNCGHDWNTIQHCVNATTLDMTNINGTQSAIEFWTRRVLGMTESISDPGDMQWYLVATLTLTWILVYLIIWKGLHSSGKIIWFTALFPYVLIFILLGYSCSRPGAGMGIDFYLTPNLTRLTDPIVWVDAGTQVMYSYGIGFSSLIALGCYNKYHHNNQRDALIIGVINSGTSILAGFVVFSSLGYFATKQGKSIEDVAEQGPGLIFQVYPQVFLLMPVSQLWSVIFFFMVCILGIDSQFCQVEGVMAGFQDQWPHLFRTHKKKLTLLVCFVFYILAWPQVDQGGIYIFQLMDTMAASGPALLWVVFWEVVAITWIYGLKKFYHGLHHMIGHKTPIDIYIFWWGFCWAAAIPIICVGILAFWLVNYTPVTYGTYKYPEWGEALGWLMSCFSMVMIPGFMIYYLIVTPGTLCERLRKGITPLQEPRWLQEAGDPRRKLQGKLVKAAEKGTEIPREELDGVYSISYLPQQFPKAFQK